MIFFFNLNEMFTGVYCALFFLSIFIYLLLFTFTYLFVLLVFCYSRPINCNHQNGNKEGLKYFTFLLSVVFMEMRFFFYLIMKKLHFFSIFKFLSYTSKQYSKHTFTLSNERTNVGSSTCIKFCSHTVKKHA